LPTKENEISEVNNKAINNKAKQEKNKPTWIRISIVQEATKPERPTKENEISEINNKARQETVNLPEYTFL